MVCIPTVVNIYIYIYIYPYMKIYIYIYARMHVYINLLIRQFNWKWVGLKFQLPCWWNWCLALVGRFTGGLSVYVKNLMCRNICVYERTTCKWAVLIFILRRICERADVCIYVFLPVCVCLSCGYSGFN